MVLRQQSWSVFPAADLPARKISKSILPPPHLDFSPFLLLMRWSKRHIFCCRHGISRHACSILQAGNVRTSGKYGGQAIVEGGHQGTNKKVASNKYESCFSRNPEKVERLDQEQQWHSVPRWWLTLEFGATTVENWAINSKRATN